MSYFPLLIFISSRNPKCVNKICKEKRGNERNKNIKYCGYFSFHFVDDIMMFGQGSNRELKSIHNILDIYYRAIGMEIHISKSIMLFNKVEEEVRMQFMNLFPKNFVDVYQDVKYLGFNLNPNDFEYGDWVLLYNKIEVKFFI
jgi:hypothetical protein